jgi:lipopolysaccharide transport system permease protein
MAPIQSVNQERVVTLIRPGRGWRALDFGELWAHRELLFMFVWRDLKIRYRQTLLGALWVFGQPLLGMLIYTFVFQRVARFAVPATIPYPALVLSGLLMWNMVANGITRAANSLIGQSFLISKVYFPRLLLPFSGIVTELVDLGVASVLLVFLLVWYHVFPGPRVLLAPLVVLVAALLAAGGGLWAAALNVKYRDVRIVIPFALQIGTFVTPVVYPISALPPRYRAVALANPMTGIVEAFRACLFGTSMPVLGFAISIGITAIVLISGLFYFRRIERVFADVL